MPTHQRPEIQSVWSPQGRAGQGDRSLVFIERPHVADNTVRGGCADDRQKPEIGELLRFAALAPSGHNTRPWTFRATGDRIDVVPDLSRRTPIVDPDDHHLFVGIGCAAENLALSSSARGRPGELRFDPSNVGSAVFEAAGGKANPSALFDAIPKRQSSPNDYAGKPVSGADLRTLASAAAVPGVDLIPITAFVAEKPDPEHWFLAGPAAERFALQATAFGLKCAFVNQPVEVAGLRPELASLIGVSGRRPDLVMRSGSGPTLPYSARRSATLALG